MFLFIVQVQVVWYNGVKLESKVDLVALRAFLVEKVYGGGYVRVFGSESGSQVFLGSLSADYRRCVCVPLVT